MPDISPSDGKLYDEAFKQWLEEGDFASRPPSEIEKASFLDFIHSTDTFKSLMDRVDFLLPGHNETMQPSAYLLKLHQAAQDVLNPDTLYQHGKDQREYDFGDFSMIVREPPLITQERHSYRK